MINWNSESGGYADASELGLPPGSFPQEVEADGLRLVRSGAVVRAGEVLVVNYLTEDGRLVEVYND